MFFLLLGLRRHAEVIDKGARATQQEIRIGSWTRALTRTKFHPFCFLSR